jgi:hypothetical protein
LIRRTRSGGASPPSEAKFTYERPSDQGSSSSWKARVEATFSPSCHGSSQVESMLTRNCALRSPNAVASAGTRPIAPRSDVVPAAAGGGAARGSL